MVFSAATVLVQDKKREQHVYIQLLELSSHLVQHWRFQVTSGSNCGPQASGSSGAESDLELRCSVCSPSMTGVTPERRTILFAVRYQPTGTINVLQIFVLVMNFYDH